MNRRRLLSLAAFPLGATILSGCGSAGLPKPPGDWQRVSDGNLVVAVPSVWKMGGQQEANECSSDGEIDGRE